MRKKEKRMHKLKLNLLLFFILFIAALFRFYKINWDEGFHFHPDERMITIVSEQINLPKNIYEFFTAKSPLNPNFFAYGSLPIYLLRFSSLLLSNLDPKFSTYQKMNLVGRGISTFSDLGTILVIYLIAKRVWNKRVGLYASIFYTLSAFPIQAAHFFAVDTLLSFLIITTIYRLIVLYEKPSLANSLYVGTFFGLSLATKVSATVLVVSIGVALTVDLLLIFIRKVRLTKLSPKIYKHFFNFILWSVTIFETPKRQVLIKEVLRIAKFGFSITLTSALTFLIFEPYALIDYKNFIQQTLSQHQMTKSAYTFPYTLQYVDTTPYIYHLKNLLLWGMEIPLGLLSIISVVWLISRLIKEVPKPGKEIQEAKILIIVSFTLIYFLVVGHFAIKFMRYLLPIYSTLCIISGYFIDKLMDRKSDILNKVYMLVFIFVVSSSLIWSSSFISIYSRPQTRIAATNWIIKNIPEGKAIAIEHWDDRVPLYGNYKFLEMPMYDPDSLATKWARVSENLQNADYLVIASNRLYTPLQKLTDCTKYEKCYPWTSLYYKQLFAGQLGFAKVAEFTSYPTVPLLNIEIVDDNSDESFTVYDHPKIMIFEKISSQSFLKN